jgi:hypothetical protein
LIRGSLKDFWRRQNEQPRFCGRTEGAMMGASLTRIAVFASIGIFVLSAASQSSKSETEISQALSAAPASIAAQASVIILRDQGRREELRSGTNGWTCIIRDVNAHEDGIAHHPACFDKYGLEWMEDYIAGREPDPDHVGYSYMLEGGSSWSNIDPKAVKLAPGQKDYIRIPAHIMPKCASRKLLRFSVRAGGARYAQTIRSVWRNAVRASDHSG